MNDKIKLRSPGQLFITLVLLLGFSCIASPGGDLLARELINFSNYTWRIKHYVRYTVGPGPNYWSSSARNVRVDES
ncbi:MAG: hypothetical protein ACOC6I_02455, partial [Candidatus Bipolaricaulota bacterium]